MIISIAAIDKKKAIGRGGDLLAHIKEDMAHFKRNTQGHTVIMGRKTLESFPGKKPLPNRNNIVLSKNKEFCVPGAQVVHSLEELFALIEDTTDDDIFVIGGSHIYAALLPYCSRQILTEIDDDLNGDVFYPDFDKSQWKKTYLSDMLGEGQIRFRFVQYDRIRIE